MGNNALYQLAALYGIAVTPGDDTAAAADVEAHIVALLAAAGVPIQNIADAGNLLEAARGREWGEILDPVLVVREKDLPWRIPLRLPEETDPEWKWLITEENGSRQEGTFTVTDLPVEARFDRGGQQYARRLLSLAITLPCGYHRFAVGAAARQEEPSLSVQLIVAPRQCYLPPGIAGDNRVWGLSLHLHALRSKKSWAVGDFSALQQILSWAAENGAGVLHTDPMGALSWPVADVPNPYSPSCRPLSNVLFLDVEAVADLRECREALERLGSAKFQARLAALRDQEYIDFPGVYRTKDEILQLLWQYFSTNHLNPETEQGQNFRNFQKERDDILRCYAIFTVLQEKFHADTGGITDWRQWPEEYRHPRSAAVAEFARQHPEEIEYHQYLQWQTELQLAAVGRRSMELGLKVGLLAELPFAPGAGGFETWYYPGLFIDGAQVARNPLTEPGGDPSIGLAVPVPKQLREMGFRPLIESLRHTMRYAGALLLRGLPNYFETPLAFAGLGTMNQAAAVFPVADLLAIIALESQRNRCLVIADSVQPLSEEKRRLLQEMNVFASLSCFRDKTARGEWLPVSAYPRNAVTGAAPPFLAALKGYWAGKDIEVMATEKIFLAEAEKEKTILTRAADRAHALINLQHEGLLPEGYGVDPAAVPEFDQPLFTALQIYLARTPARIHLVSMADLLAQEEQATPPQLTASHFWQSRYPLDLEAIISRPEVVSLLLALCRERGPGVVRPSAPATDRKKRQGIRTPSSFYRLQFHKGFTFLQAAEIVPYLSMLGISHCYASPFLMARPGSPHGYDIINHGAINPEIGSREDFEQFIAVLEQHRMALLLDIVPNHMGIGSDNGWWMDVLENGEASEYAGFFDINWQPLQINLANRVLLPVLGDHYGTVLEGGQLALRFTPGSGRFHLRYFEHSFPLDPRTYPAILGHDLKRLADLLGEQHHGFLELQTLITSFGNLPERRERSAESLETRQRNKEVNKRTLARLCREAPEIKRFLEENVIIFNGEPGRPESFDLLHGLLENQAYRLAFWRVAADEINYRRFFDINDLAGLRMQEEKVYQETHRLVSDLIMTGKLDGLRVDHPDGLYDPQRYFCRLQAIARGEPLEQPGPAQPAAADGRKAPLYVVVEKILAHFEHLPGSWPVAGTTGYECANMLTGLLVDAASEKAMTAIYHQFIGRRVDFDDLLYRSKKLIISSSMAGELNVLASELYRLAQASRTTRDFTLNRLREALTEIIAAFPVYRTYITGDSIHKTDSHFIKWALAKARGRNILDDGSIFEFISDVLLLRARDKEALEANYLDFVHKFQQYTGPVMAKGLEDTAFYRYNRLLSLNDVGGEPLRFGTSLAAFHRANQERMHHWPQAMVNTSTHDSKRSEDVRARINVLTEMPQAWHRRLSSWRRLNRHHKTRLGNILAPAPNDEYALYQNLLGTWPLPGKEGGSGQGIFAERLKSCMLKACREAKEHTSWIHPNEVYEEAMNHFIDKTLAETNEPFLRDFLPFQEIISWFGMLNSLSLVLLKLTVPGVPDIYQGNELWRFCLVDPDNRRPVDFHKRQALLQGLLPEIEGPQADSVLLLQEMLAGVGDGRAKMYTIARTLRLRNVWQDIFQHGAYLPLAATGDKCRHLCAFARRHGEHLIMVIVPRLYLHLMAGQRGLPLGPAVWGETTITLPKETEGMQFENVFSREPVAVNTQENSLHVSEALKSWPVALLKNIV